jgi:hypothetical protein
VIGWLGVRRDWRRLGWFVAASFAITVLTLGIVQWVSQGRFMTTLLTLTFAGTGGASTWIRAPSQLVFFGAGDAAAVWIIAPFAILGVLAAWQSRALTVYDHAFGWSLLLTLVVFTDLGAGLNQLLDSAVLTVITAGSLASRFPLSCLGTVTLPTALALSTAWAGVTGIRGFVPDLRGVASSLRTGRAPQRYNPRPLANVVPPGDTLLAEDPSIPILLGRLPIVGDPFMLRRLDEVQPEAVDVLVARIERGTFDHVALINSLDGEDGWWRDYHLGLRVVTALRKSYVLVGVVDGYYLYRPHRS